MNKIVKEGITFEDVLIIPRFTSVSSRKEVNLSVRLFHQEFKLPLISAPMDTVTGCEMCKAMTKVGGVGMLHRFMSIEDNIKEFIASDRKAICSIGISDDDLKRAVALVDVGCKVLNIDTANGGMVAVSKFYNKLLDSIPKDVCVVVGAFADPASVTEFLSVAMRKPDAIRVNIGGGSVCQTRIVTGCGYPLLQSILDIKTAHPNLSIICDGGVENSGDIAKALAAGASMVMSGYLFAGTKESLGEPFITHRDYGLISYGHLVKIDTKLGDTPRSLDEYIKAGLNITHKNYRGSASHESYEVQRKVSSFRAPEGVSTLIPYKGDVDSVLQTLEGGLRSSLSYVGAFNLTDFYENTQFIKVTNAVIQESKPYAKN